MCGRFFLDPEDELLADLFKDLPEQADLKRRGEIFPGDRVPVFAPTRRLHCRLFPMRWRFPLWEGADSLINIRSETAAEKALFRDSARQRRCVIPCSAFYEWSSKKEKFAFSSSTLLCMAGLYTFFEGEACFAILTRAALGAVSGIHARMPLLLQPADLYSWLDPSCGYALPSPRKEPGLFCRRLD